MLLKFSLMCRVVVLRMGCECFRVSDIDPGFCFDWVVIPMLNFEVNIGN